MSSRGNDKHGASDDSENTSKLRKECTNFEPQTWRKNVCQNCFKMKSQHGSSSTASPLAIRRLNKDTSSDNDEVIQSPTAETTGSLTSSPRGSRKLIGSGSPRAGRKSLERTGSGKSSPSGSKRTTPESKRKDYKDETRPNSKSLGYEKNDTSLSRSRSASKESLRSASASRNTMDEKYIEELENDLFDLEDKCDVLESKRNNLETELSEKIQHVEELQSEVDNYRVKISTLEKKIIQLESEVRTYRERLKLPESEQSELNSAESPTAQESVEEFYQELLEENEQLKEEVDELQRELSEMHDSFHEDESANMAKELQRELDAANKSYRVIQFKLRKAERRFEQSEAERNELEEKFRRLGERLLSGDESAQIQELEDELRMAKEVSVRLHDELEFIEEKRVRLDNENHRLKFELETSERDRIRLENEIDRVKLELEKVKCEHGLSDAGPLQVLDKSSPRPRLGVVASRESSIEEEQLKRELGATKERETDLVEQLRYSKEEIKILKRKLEEAEEESESLSSKLAKLAGGSSPSRIRFGSDDSEIDLDDLDKSTAKKKNTEEFKETTQGDSGDNSETNKESRQRLLNSIDSDIQDLKEVVKKISIIPKDEYNVQEQWIEASEAKKQLELRVDELRRQIYELENENGKLRIELETSSSPKSLKSSPSSVQDLDAANKADLIKELSKMEDVIEELTISVKQGEFKNEQMDYRIKTLEQELSESRSNYENEERFFISQFEKLQKRNEILGDLLSVITARRRYIYESNEDNESDPNQIKAENDEVFTDKLPEEVQYWDSTFRERLHSLEDLLNEERLRSRQYQKKLDNLRIAQKSDEKDFEKYKIIVDEKEAQITEYKIKLEQSRKMYEALKVLVDDNDLSSSKKTAEERVAEKSGKLEFEGNRTELVELKKRYDQMSNKQTKMESERLAMEKNLHILNEELRLREEHIFEQDDMIRSLQRKLQDADREFERLKNELTQLKTQFTSVKEKNSESFKLREELQKSMTNVANKEKLIGELKQKISDQESEASANTERVRTLQDAVRSRDERIKEKDELISLINTRLANREREITDLDNMLKQTNSKLANTEEEMSNVKNQMMEQEKEVKTLRSKMNDLQDSAAKQSTELFEVRKKHENLSKLFEKFKNENQKQLGDVMKERDDLKQTLEQCKYDKFSYLQTPSSGYSSPHSQPMLAEKVNDTSLALANAPIEVQIKMRHLQQIEKIYLQLTHQQITMKLQVEAYQKEVEEFRELYYQLKEKHRKASESWAFERENYQKICAKHERIQEKDVHELKQELTQKDKHIMQIEAEMYRLRQDHASQTSKLEKEKLDLLVKCGGFAEDKKIPKVLQRFAGNKRANISNVDGGAFESERKEYQVRLQEQEKKIDKLRKELRDLSEKTTAQDVEILQKYAKENIELTKRVEDMKFDSDQLNDKKDECIRLHEKFRSIEEQLFKERRRWQTEKTALQYSSEQYKVMLDQWLDRFMNAVEEFENGQLDKTRDKGALIEEMKVVLKVLTDEINKYKLKSNIREKSPTRHRLRANNVSIDESTESDDVTNPTRPNYSSMAKPPQSSSSGLVGVNLSGRSISMDWTKSFFRSESPFRSKRAPSPDVKKITSYPDPSPGFWIKPSSRTNSRENLNLASSQTNLSCPTYSLVKFAPQINQSGDSGSTSSLQSKISSSNAEARRKFYQSYDQVVYASNDKLGVRLVEGSSEDMTRSVHESQSPHGIMSSTDKRDLFSKKSHSIEVEATESQDKDSSSSKPPPNPKTVTKKTPFGVNLKSTKSDKTPSKISSKVSSLQKLFQK